MEVKMNDLETANILPIPLDNCYVFDLTRNNSELANINLDDEAEFSNYIFGTLEKNGAKVGIGRYAEDRVIYARSGLFDGQEARTIHLGLDLWVPSGTSVHAPLSGEIFGFGDNAGYGDYGPTIVIKHRLEEEVIHTLYGHLSRESLDGLQVGKAIDRGEQIATIGDYTVNGNWPAHLHFQLVQDMEGQLYNYPGVCTQSDLDKYLVNCPDPDLILKIPNLQTRGEK
jgi:peptidoglycan LD-endopeptidase LytH